MKNFAVFVVLLVIVSIGHAEPPNQEPTQVKPSEKKSTLPVEPVFEFSIYQALNIQVEEKYRYVPHNTSPYHGFMIADEVNREASH